MPSFARTGNEKKIIAAKKLRSSRSPLKFVSNEILDQTPFLLNEDVQGFQIVFPSLFVYYIIMELKFLLSIMGSPFSEHDWRLFSSMPKKLTHVFVSSNDATLVIFITKRSCSSKPSSW